MHSFKKILGAALAFVSFASQGALFADWKEGDTTPDLAAFELAGELPDLEGKVVYLDFWASWCPPCKASFPAMERLQQRFGPEGFQIVAVSVDQSAKQMERFLDVADPSFVTLHDPKQSLAGDTGLRSLPTSYLIDAKGVIRSIQIGWGGEASETALTAQIESLLQEKTAR